MKVKSTDLLSAITEALKSALQMQNENLFLDFSRETHKNEILKNYKAETIPKRGDLVKYWNSNFVEGQPIFHTGILLTADYPYAQVLSARGTLLKIALDTLLSDNATLKDKNV